MQSCLALAPVVATASLVFALVGTYARAQPVGPADPPLASETLDLLQAEILDTVTLDKPMHFTTPGGQVVLAGPDHYRVEPVEATTLRLIPEKGDGPVLIHALRTHHGDEIPAPIAVLVSEADDSLHVVLLLPGGKALEAIGSVSGVRPRAGGARVLSPEQLHQALLRKQAASNPTPSPRQP